MPISQPIYDIDAEEATLGSLILDGEATKDVIGWLKLEHFGRDKNRWVYQAILTLYREGEDINQITVGHELARAGRLNQYDAWVYLDYLVWRTPTSVYLESYARIVARLGYQRELLTKGKVDLPIPMQVGIPQPKKKAITPVNPARSRTREKPLSGL